MEFSHAMRTINSKFKDKMPTRRSVKVGDLNSAAQPQIKGRANSPYRYPYADDGDDDFLPSPPTAKFRASGSTDSSADAVRHHPPPYSLHFPPSRSPTNPRGPTFLPPHRPTTSALR